MSFFSALCEKDEKNPTLVIIIFRKTLQRRSQYEANRGTRLGKILTNFADHFYFT